MIVVLWAAVSLAEPVSWVDAQKPPYTAPYEGRISGKDPRDARDRPYDAYVLDPPANTWVEVTVRDYAFPLRVRVGDAESAFSEQSRDPAVAYGWSPGGPLQVEVGTGDKAVVGPYAVSVAFVTPSTTEPPAADALPPYVKIEPDSWVVDGWFCDLVTLRFPDPRTFTVMVLAEDAGRMRVLAGRWEDGHLRVEADSVPPEGSRRPAPLEIQFAADVPRVFGVCRDRLGSAYLDVHKPGDDIAPGTVIDPTRPTMTLDEATAAEQKALEGRMSTVVAERGDASNYKPVVVPLFLQSGFAYEAIVLTEEDTDVPAARLYLAYCDATCEAFAARSGLPMTRDGSWYVLDLPDSDATQAYNPTHVERWRFTWPEGTSLTAMLQVYVKAAVAQRLRVLVGEE